MATIVENYGESNEKLDFVQSSDEDRAYAKTFWQNIQLLPPMESTLVSKEIHQRLKTAPFRPPKPYSYYRYKKVDSPRVLKCLEDAQAKIAEERLEKLKEITIRKEETHRLFEKRMSERHKLEEISNPAGPPPLPPPPPEPIDDPNILRDMDVPPHIRTYNEIDAFEQLLNI